MEERPLLSDKERRDMAERAFECNVRLPLGPLRSRHARPDVFSMCKKCLLTSATFLLSRLPHQVCLELAHDPVVTICGHLHCWPCLYRCVSCGTAKLMNTPREQPRVYSA